MVAATMVAAAPSQVVPSARIEMASTVAAAQTDAIACARRGRCGVLWMDTNQPALAMSALIAPTAAPMAAANGSQAIVTMRCPVESMSVSRQTRSGRTIVHPRTAPTTDPSVTPRATTAAPWPTSRSGMSFSTHPVCRVGLPDAVCRGHSTAPIDRFPRHSDRDPLPVSNPYDFAVDAATAKSGFGQLT